MKLNRISALVLGLLAVQIAAPSFDASAVTQPVAQQSATISYAPKSATSAQVKAAAPTDLVVFNDTALEANIAQQLGVAVGEITVADMETLVTIKYNDTNISDLTGLEYAVNATKIDLDKNNISDLRPIAELTKLVELNVSENSITDITPIAGLTNLTTLFANHNQISNIEAMTGLTNLRSLYLNWNMISDISPLSAGINSGVLHYVDIVAQTINLPDRAIMDESENLQSEVIGINGEVYNFKLHKRYDIKNSYEGNIIFDIRFVLTYSATVNQKAIVGGMSASDTAEVNEGTALTDAELIALFDVDALDPSNTIIDQSAVNYNKPDTYNVVITNGKKTITSTLTIKDVAPVITLNNMTVTLTVGDKAPDYLALFGAVATEFTTGDLNANITADDSAVDYSKAGTYKVTFIVTDADGTVESKQGDVVVEESLVVIPEETPTEIEIPTEIETPTETTTDTTTETTTETTTDTTTETDEQTTASVTAMTAENKKTLTKTGSNTTMIFVVYTMILAMIVTVKKTLASKN